MINNSKKTGFALIASLSIMALLVLIGLALFSLASVATRSAEVASARTQSQANAKMALMVALGELQLEMGPDMRISAEAAIHDSTPEDETMDDVAQPHWLAVYDSWGNWLNAEYTPEGKLASEVSSIRDTYGPKRASMFRRWLVSLPEEMKNDVESAVSPLREDDEVDDWVIMVGEGTLGSAHVAANPEKVTRAYRIPASDRSNYAWWLSPENHKAKIGLAAREREQNGELSADEWATAQGVSSEVAIGAIDGLESLDTSNAGAAENAGRVINLGTLPLVGVDGIKAQEMFFDLTDASSGVLSNTRSGGLKKDLSLLFENSDTELQTVSPQYVQASRLAPEPSIRPHSKDILAYDSDLPRRPFAGWPDMRHYYRMYREDTDSALPARGSEGEIRYLQNDGGKPLATIIGPENMRTNVGNSDGDNRWFGENAYLRHPILVRYLLIHSYVTDRYDDTRTGQPEISLHYFVTPVLMLWNPYSTPLVMEDRSFGFNVSVGATWPHRLLAYDETGTQVTDNNNIDNDYQPVAVGAPVPITSNPNPTSFAQGAPIIFEPGEFKVFSFPANTVLDTQGTDLSNDPRFALVPGYVPGALGSLGRIRDDGRQWGERVSKNGSIAGFEIEVQLNIARDAANTREGNTPGSLTIRGGPEFSDFKDDGLPPHYQIDWFQESEHFQSVSRDENGSRNPLIETSDILPIAYTVMTLKTTNLIETSPAAWDEDWRSRNWLHSPPSYFGSGLYMSEDDTTAHTQRLDSPYQVSFGPSSPSELQKFTGETFAGKPFLGVGSNPYEKITSAPSIELPSAPLSSLASFSGMRMNPGWIWPQDLNPDWEIRLYDGQASGGQRLTEMATDNASASDYGGSSKVFMYQSGITGGGIGNSFIHPMIPREEVYHKHDNSISMDIVNWGSFANSEPWAINNILQTVANDTEAYSDYWDHVLLLNDALWDEYFISSIADQTRPWASEADNLQANLDALTDGDPLTTLPINRYDYYDAGLADSEVQDKLTQDDAYLRAAEHLTVDGAFNVNSTSVKAWYALFKGIRERKLYFRNTDTGNLEEVDVPDEHIALSRFDTPTTDQEMTDLGTGINRDDGHDAWSGVRFLDDDHIRLLAQKCVEQVKKRGPFLNFSEFINRRLEDSELGLMGALQSAIDYDDASPEPESINYRYKSTNNLRISPSDLGDNEYETPEAVEGSRLAGIPGYVIQSDLLKPIANTLQVRDDTFRIRAYGETLDPEGRVIARAWCEAIVQRNPEYLDPGNDAYEAAFNYEAAPPDGYDPRWDGELVPNTALTDTNRQFGRKFEIVSFRWLTPDEV